jgi:nitrite reductase/ring-hydroxylating ferredoxin subunit
MTIDGPTFPIPAAYPLELTAPGSVGGVTIDGGSLADLPEGTMRRVTHGDLDVLIAHTPAGILAVDDRCPHMSAPLSIGELEGCVVQCPLHEGRFDLCSGAVVQMPTTGGLDADGAYHATWSHGKDPKIDPPGKKADARRLTRVRRFRYYPLRIVEGRVEVTVPVVSAEDLQGA